MKKLIISASSSVLAASLLVACSDSSTSEPATATVTEQAEATPTQDQNQAVDRPENVPTAVSSYSTQAEMEMQEDQLTEADVEAVVQAANDGQAKVEWDKDGYFELEHNGIDVDITPEGEVLDAGR